MKPLQLGDDDQTDAPRKPQFWLGGKTSRGAIEEWVGWLAVRGEVSNPLSDHALAGLHALIIECVDLYDHEELDGYD